MNLNEGRILSPKLVSFFKSDIFPKVSWWISTPTDKLPPAELIKDEFGLQYKTLKELNLNLTGIDYHQLYPVKLKSIWNAYTEFVTSKGLKYRGGKFYYTNSSFIKTITPGSIRYVAKALINNPLITMSNLRSKYDYPEGDYHSEFSLLYNSNQIEETIKILSGLNLSKPIELISHVATEDILNTNIALKHNRFEEYLNILKLSI